MSLKAEEQEFAPKATPTGGILLIGRPVLARRHSDGLFYRATVKSELARRGEFLIEFEALQHGAFKDVEYQETNAFEIVALDDALRHAILPGDHVLASDEAKEAYRPATVLQGVEKRDHKGRFNVSYQRYMLKQ